MRAARPALRRANRDDCLRLWDWANDPATRAASFAPDPIAWADHQRWFDAHITSPLCAIFIAEDAGIPIGQVRFDLEGTDEAEIDLSIITARRGQGLAVDMLRTACSLFRRQFDARLVAHVRLDNPASLRVFRSAGFLPAGTGVVRGCPAARFEYQPPDRA